MVGLSKNFASYLFFCGLAFALLVPSASARQNDYRLLYSFCSQLNCADGSPPSGQLVADSKGNLYGETEWGGGGPCPSGCGTVFKLASDGTETVLYQFCAETNCADGAYPTGGLIADEQGNLYGTTSIGGANCGSVHCVGTVFKLSLKGIETVLHSFCSMPAGSQVEGCTDGFYPNGGVIMDKEGKLYGTTEEGGSAVPALGTVFKIAPDGKETVLYSFCQKSSCADGADPASGLILDKHGNLYGTAGGGYGLYCGESGCGTVFKVAPDGTETVLHTFCTMEYCPDGENPTGKLVVDGHGNVYGMTTYGGHCDFHYGCGTIFEISPDGNESVLHNFCSMENCRDGYYPYAGLIADSQYNFYGTASFGSGQGCGGTGCGTVVKFGSDGKLRVLATFEGPSSGGAFPQSGLIADKSGHLFGTTYEGGTSTQCGYPLGCGTVFALRQ